MNEGPDPVDGVASGSPVFADERQARMAELVSVRGRARIGELSKLFDKSCWLWYYQTLSRLPRVDLVSDGDFRFNHYVAIFPQGVDVTLYGGLAPHNVVHIGIEDYWFR